MEDNYQKRKFDRIFFSFPLCLLAISENKKEVVRSILLFSLENYKRNKYCFGFSLDTNKLEFSKEEIEIYEKEISDLTMEINFQIRQRFNFAKVFVSTIQYVKDFERVHNTDMYCRIGKNLFQEVFDGIFDYLMFSIYCAIRSIIGRSLVERITKANIKFRMLGYKSKMVYLKSNDRKHFISDKKLDGIVKMMCAKKLISKFTYQRRQTFYSIRIKSKKLLAKTVEQKKLNQLKHRMNKIDQKYSDEIKKKLEYRKQTIAEMKEELNLNELVKVFSINGAKKRHTL